MAKNKNSEKSALAGVSVGDWCSEHWFLTFLLVSSALGVVGSMVSSNK